MCCSLIFDNLHHSDLVSAVNLVLLQFYIQREKKFTMGIMANKQTNSRSFKTPFEYTVDTQSKSCNRYQLSGVEDAGTLINVP